jgi:hypothetical protein
MTMTLLRELPSIDRAASEEAWEWLQESAPIWADAVAEEVRAGATPEVIYQGVLRRVGGHREALAVRCKLAAMHLVTEREAERQPVGR